MYILLNLNYIKLFFKFSRESSRTNYSGNSIVMPEDIGEGLVKVGKIIFDTGQVLGKGCEGTFVYKYVIFLIYLYVCSIYLDCFKYYFCSCKKVNTNQFLIKI